MKFKKVLIAGLGILPFLTLTACGDENNTDIIEANNLVKLILICKSDDGVVDSTATLNISKNEVWNQTSPEAEGYEFKGWYCDSKYLMPIKNDFTPKNDTVLYGKMVKIDSSSNNEQDENSTNGALESKIDLLSSSNFKLDECITIENFGKIGTDSCSSNDTLEIEVSDKSTNMSADIQIPFTDGLYVFNGDLKVHYASNSTSSSSSNSSKFKMHGEYNGNIELKNLSNPNKTKTAHLEIQTIYHDDNRHYTQYVFEFDNNERLILNLLAISYYNSSGAVSYDNNIDESLTSYLTQRLNATYNGIDKHIENSEIEVSYYSTTDGATFAERFTLKNR